MERIKVALPVVVEGKYDKIKLSSVIDGKIITTEGFGIFKSSEKRMIIKRLSENGIIVLCDSDGAGKLIRSHLSGIVAPDKIYNLYVPRIEGKEKRKKTPSKEGVLGVEGIDTDTLAKLFSDFTAKTDDAAKSYGEPITKADFFEAGFTGNDGCKARRDSFAVSEGLPPDMTPNALLAALNVIMTRDEFLKLTEDTHYDSRR